MKDQIFEEEYGQIFSSMESVGDYLNDLSQPPKKYQYEDNIIENDKSSY
jgi:hypothetical protein